MTSDTQAKNTIDHEIDREHNKLGELAVRLADICLVPRNTRNTCSICSPPMRSACANRIADVLSDLLGFMVGHFAFEEKLMKRLDRSSTVAESLEDHKLAHAQISHRLATLAETLDEEEPLHVASLLRHIVTTWMDGHARLFDERLIEALRAGPAEPADRQE
jgi:hemerythrin-like metal-binding protein